MKLEVISFDFGGTLAYETKEDHIVFNDVLRELGLDVNEGDVKQALMRARRWWKQKKGQGKIWTQDSYVKFVNKALSYTRIEHRADLAGRVAELWPRMSEYRAYEDVEPTLKGLREEGYRLVLISNVSSLRNLSVYLSKTNLTKYFDLLVASGSVGMEKPNRGIFLLASDSLGVEPNRMVHVGDDYEADYLGAIASGFTAVLIDRANKHTNKDITRIKSLTELPQLIRHCRLE